MPLKAKPPEEINDRLKMMLYGAPGAGKTTAAVSFPKPYIIDTEGSCQKRSYREIIKSSGGVVLKTTDCDELIAEVEELLSTKHDYLTLVIDTMTMMHDNLIAKEIKIAERKSKPGFEIDMRAVYGKRTRSMQRLMNLLLRLDMNIIIVCHVKEDFQGQNSLIDCFKNLERMFDLVVEIKKSGIGETASRIGRVHKTRLKESFPEGEVFDFSYEEISRRYGRDIIEKESEPTVFASNEQVLLLTKLVMLAATPAETVEKWLEKAKCNSYKDMPADIIQKCIDSLEKSLGKGV